MPVVISDFAGSLYYVYMVVVIVFCCNSISFLSGVNGLEVGQCVVIGTFMLILNFEEVCKPYSRYHQISIYFMIPFLATAFGLLKYNW